MPGLIASLRQTGRGSVDHIDLACVRHAAHVLVWNADDQIDIAIVVEVAGCQGRPQVITALGDSVEIEILGPVLIASRGQARARAVDGRHSASLHL